MTYLGSLTILDCHYRTYGASWIFIGAFSMTSWWRNWRSEVGVLMLRKCVPFASRELVITVSWSRVQWNAASFTHGHFRSRDKDGGHSIRSAITENPMLHTDFMSLCFVKPGLLPVEVLRCGNGDFGPLLILWPWLWLINFIYELDLSFGYASMNFLHHGFHATLRVSTRIIDWLDLLQLWNAILNCTFQTFMLTLMVWEPQL